MLFIAMLFSAVFMPCFVVFGIIFLRPSENPFERILGWATLGMAVWCNAIGQMILEEPLVYSWPEPLPSWFAYMQLVVGIVLIGIAFRGLPAANRSFDELADETLRKVEEIERAASQHVQH